MELNAGVMAGGTGKGVGSQKGMMQERGSLVIFYLVFLTWHVGSLANVLPQEKIGNHFKTLLFQRNVKQSISTLHANSKDSI